MHEDEGLFGEDNRPQSKETETVHGELSQPRKRKDREETVIKIRKSQVKAGEEEEGAG